MQSSDVEAAFRGFTVISSFRVEDDQADQVEEAFRARPHEVDDADGFSGLQVLRRRGDDSDEFWLVTFWRDREAYATWYASHAYKQSHRMIPEGLKLVKGSVVIREFDHIGS